MTESMEIFYKNLQCYEITINPEDKYQFFGEDLRSVRVHQTLYDVLVKYVGPYAKFHLIPELSEPKSGNKTFMGPRLHYHGIIYFTNVYEFLIQGFYQLSRSNSIQINNFRPEHWPKYITKQQSIIKPNIRHIRNIGINDLIALGEARNELSSKEDKLHSKGV